MFEEMQDQGKSPTEIAKELGVHVGTVYRWMYSEVRGRKLSSVLVGGRRRILKHQLDAFLQLDDGEVAKTDAHRSQRAQNALASFGVRSQKMGGPKP